VSGCVGYSCELSRSRRSRYDSGLRYSEARSGPTWPIRRLLVEEVSVGTDRWRASVLFPRTGCYSGRDVRLGEVACSIGAYRSRADDELFGCNVHLRKNPLLVGQMRAASRSGNILLSGRPVRRDIGEPRAQHRIETIFDACSTCRVRASILPASAPPRRACLLPSDVGSRQVL
jgi:hypothetical protein